MSRRHFQQTGSRNGRTESARRRNPNFYVDKVHAAKSRIRKAVRRRGKGVIPADNTEDAVTWLLENVPKDDDKIGRGTEVISVVRDALEQLIDGDVLIETDQGFSLNS